MDSGIDSIDPFSATIGGITIKPGSAVASDLSERVTEQGGAAWSGRNGSSRFATLRGATNAATIDLNDAVTVWKPRVTG